MNKMSEQKLGMIVINKNGEKVRALKVNIFEKLNELRAKLKSKDIIVTMDDKFYFDDAPIDVQDENSISIKDILEAERYVDIRT